MTRAEIAAGVAKLLSEWPGYEVVHRCMETFPQADFYLIGGAIRNIVLGRAEQKDLDVLVDASSLAHVHESLLGHGRLSVGPFGNIAWYPGEGTQWCWEFQLVSRILTGVWSCENILDVLNSADSSGNAIAYNMRTGEIIDPQNGIRDMQRRIMRGVRFDRREDMICDGRIPYPAAVWIRNLHYATVLGLSIEPVTANWIQQNKRYAEYLEVFSSTFFVPRIAPQLLPTDR